MKIYKLTERINEKKVFIVYAENSIQAIEKAMKLDKDFCVQNVTDVTEKFRKKAKNIIPQIEKIDWWKK